MVEEYKYKIDQCDFIDKESLKRYRIKREKWLEWLEGPKRDDPTRKRYSIGHQISMLIWNYTIYKTVSEFRKYAENDSNNEIGFNLPFLWLFDQCYWDSQAIAVRRLTDNNRGMISLIKLLQDIKKNSKFITRENFVSFDGVPYDYEKAIIQSFRSKEGNSGIRSVPDNENWSKSKKRHLKFDELSNTQSENRQIDDKLNKKIMDKLIKKLEDGSESIISFVNNFIAHTGHPINNATKSIKPSFSFEEFEQSIRTIYHVYNFIKIKILCEPFTASVPIPPMGHLGGFDKKWAKDINFAREKWDEVVNRIKIWENEEFTLG